MSDSKYNGWSNYATWRVNLEICDDYFASLDEDERIVLKQQAEIDGYYSLKETLREVVNDCLDLDGSTGLTRDYADAFISEVDFYEIARTQLADVVVPMAEEEAPEDE